VKSLRQHIRNFFGFSRTQTNGFVLLMLIIIVALFARPVYQYWLGNRTYDFSSERKKLDSLTAQFERTQKVKPAAAVQQENTATILFEFNPNTVTARELDDLGFPKRLSKGLLNYRSKGGSFKIKSDLKKLYGMDSTFYVSLVPYIQLPDKREFEARTSVAKREISLFNLNEADTAQFQQVYGIGPVLAKRIITYRKKLGGFVKTSQLNEVYGLDSTTVQKLLSASFLEQGFEPHKINVNTVDEQVLSSHPYFSKKLARAIVTYRFQHGKYQSVDDLRKIELLDTKTAERIYPYITVE
jgi:competence protein ComEA